MSDSVVKLSHLGRGGLGTIRSMLDGPRVIGRVVLLVALVAVAAMGGACNEGTDSPGTGLRFYFFAEGVGGADVLMDDVDLSLATLVIDDADIESYVWPEQKILLSEDAAESLRHEAGIPVYSIVVFDDERLVDGTAAWEGIAQHVSGRQLRLAWDELYLSTGEGPSPAWPDPDVLTEFGLSGSTIEAIRGHFEETGRLD